MSTQGPPPRDDGGGGGADPGAGYVTSAWGVRGGLEGEADESQEFRRKIFFSDVDHFKSLY